MLPQSTTIAALLDRYEGVLLDAYGVLVDGRGLLPGAAALLAELTRRGTPFAIVTNDASRSPATYVERFARLGVPIDAERIVTSGSLLPGYFRDHG
ncbi:MAG: haloacid dehalogenase, partial [Myxococcales bacterium]|nr:haloacid dehalogenase [Myxococcales bacterium]